MNTTIKKKMIISNILMIVVPIISFILLLCIGLSVIDFDRWDSIESVYESNTNTYYAQSIILSHKNKILHKDRKTNNYINNIEKKLEELGYHFAFYKNNDNLYNNLSIEEEKSIKNVVTKDSGNIFIENEKESILVVTFNDKNNNNNYKVLAYTNNNTIKNGRVFPNTKISLIALIIILVVLIFIIVVVTNLVLSRWITNTILKPLEMLKNGSRKIRNGNLSFEINYKKKDEFGEVCEDFNKMKEQLKLSEEARNKYEEYRKEIINGVSHDLRTPLTSIKGYVEGLQDGIANTEEKKKRYYDAIHTRAIDIEKLINSLSSLSYIENEKYKYNLTKVNLEEYINHIINNYKEELIDKNIKINYLGTDGSLVFLDKNEFKRVFDNLIENTYRYRKKDNSIVYIELKNAGDYLVLSYRDNGPGVKKEELENIFLSFYRGDKARTNPENGSGLGLSIVKRIVEGHDGTIVAKNNKGLEFIITLPIIKE